MPDQPHLLTLSEVSKRTKISMPTLQRYKKEYQGRIPSVGKDRKQRYPVEALEVVQAIKQENLAKRGRRRLRRVGTHCLAGPRESHGRIPARRLGIPQTVSCGDVQVQVPALSRTTTKTPQPKRTRDRRSLSRRVPRRPRRIAVGAPLPQED